VNGSLGKPHTDTNSTLRETYQNLVEIPLHGQSRLSVCGFVRTLKGKRLELSAPKSLVHGRTLACSDLEVKRSNTNPNPQAFTLRSGSACIRPAWVCMLIRLHTSQVCCVTNRGGWTAWRRIGAWLKRRSVLHVARRDLVVGVFVYLSSASKIVGPSDASRDGTEPRPAPV